MKNFLYKIVLRSYLFSIFFYFTFSTIFPKLFLVGNSEFSSKVYNKNSVNYYSALTSSEVKAMSKKMLLDMKYQGYMKFKKELTILQITVTEEGKVFGYYCQTDSKRIFNHEESLLLISKTLKFDVFNITRF